jgi:hypothetical protein
VKKAVIFVLGVRQQSNQLSHVLVHQGQVQGSKVIVEWVVNQFLVDGEKVRISVASGRSGPRHEIQSVLNNLNIGERLNVGLGLTPPIDARSLVLVVRTVARAKAAVFVKRHLTIYNIK